MVLYRQFNDMTHVPSYLCISPGISGTAECKNLLTSYSLWVVGDTFHSAPSSFFSNTLVINTDASFRVEVDGEGHSSGKTAHCYGMQYIIIVQ
jgi:hypothetical protein